MTALEEPRMMMAVSELLLLLAQRTWLWKRSPSRECETEKKQDAIGVEIRDRHPSLEIQTAFIQVIIFQLSSMVQYTRTEGASSMLGEFALYLT